MDSPTKDDGSGRTVVIAEIPAEVDEEDLELYLANRRLGGGDIDNIQLDKTSRTALVKFVAAEGMIARTITTTKCLFI